MEIKLEIHYDTDNDFGVMLHDSSDDHICLKKGHEMGDDDLYDKESLLRYLDQLYNCIYGKDYVIEKVKKDLLDIINRIKNGENKIDKYFDYGNQQAQYSIEIYNIDSVEYYGIPDTDIILLYNPDVITFYNALSKYLNKEHDDGYLAVTEKQCEYFLRKAHY